MNQFLFQLRSVWPRAIFWAFIASVSLVALCYAGAHVSSGAILGEGVAFLTSAEQEQFEAILVSESHDWRYGFGTMASVPLLLLTLGLIGRVGATFTNKRYVVVSSMVLQNAVAIGMTADSSMTDALGHVNYIASASNLDCVREALMDQLGWPVEKMRAEHGMSFMMKTVELSYRRQIKEGDRLHLRGTITQTSPVRIEIHAQIFVGDESEKPAVEAKYTMPLVSFATGRPVPIPDWYWMRARQAKG
jgi:acyl-CoA thioesterase FadM